MPKLDISERRPTYYKLLPQRKYLMRRNKLGVVDYFRGRKGERWTKEILYAKRFDMLTAARTKLPKYCTWVQW